MSHPFPTGLGAVLSADIAVPQHEQVLRFYSRVLTTGDEPLWRDDLMNNLGIPIIGIGKRTDEHAELPLQWMPHIQVPDVGASARRALELGGTELMHVRGDDGTSQWAVLLDPNGAAFGLIPVVPGDAIPPMEADARVGRIAWLDLTVPDADVTRDFYREVVGWSVQEVEIRDGGDRYDDYSMLRPDGDAGAGICHARGPNTGLPPVWTIYLPVGDVEASLERAKEEGGEVVRAVKGKDGEFMYATIRDPVGAYVALVPA